MNEETTDLGPLALWRGLQQLFRWCRITAWWCLAHTGLILGWTLWVTLLVLTWPVTGIMVILGNYRPNKDAIPLFVIWLVSTWIWSLLLWAIQVLCAS